MRKTTNYLRRKYQRTRNSEEKERKESDNFEHNSKYTATMKREKTKSSWNTAT